jgi:hypothetical protein
MGERDKGLKKGKGEFLNSLLNGIKQSAHGCLVKREWGEKLNDET